MKSTKNYWKIRRKVDREEDGKRRDLKGSYRCTLTRGRLNSTQVKASVKSLMVLRELCGGSFNGFKPATLKLTVSYKLSQIGFIRLKDLLGYEVHEPYAATHLSSYQAIKQFLIDRFISFFSGMVPEWLEGSLYRVGPGIFQRGTMCFNHPFDMTSVLVSNPLELGPWGLIF